MPFKCWRNAEALRILGFWRGRRFPKTHGWYYGFLVIPHDTTQNFQLQVWCGILGQKFQGSVQKHVAEDAFWKQLWQYGSNTMDKMHGWKKCLLVDVRLVDSLLLISRKKSRVRYTAHTARDVSKTTVVVHIGFYFYVFYKLVFGCLQLNFKQPIGVPKNRFLDSSRHLTRQVLSSIYVLHLKFLYGYRQKLPVISGGVPFSTPPWCKIWFSNHLQLWAALSLNHQFSPRIFGLHTVGNWLHVDEAKFFLVVEMEADFALGSRT